MRCGEESIRDSGPLLADLKRPIFDAVRQMNGLMLMLRGRLRPADAAHEDLSCRLAAWEYEAILFAADHALSLVEEIEDQLEAAVEANGEA